MIAGPITALTSNVAIGSISTESCAIRKLGARGQYRERALPLPPPWEFTHILQSLRVAMAHGTPIAAPLTQGDNIIERALYRVAYRFLDYNPSAGVGVAGTINLASGLWGQNLLPHHQADVCDSVVVAFEHERTVFVPGEHVIRTFGQLYRLVEIVNDNRLQTREDLVHTVRNDLPVLPVPPPLAVPPPAIPGPPPPAVPPPVSTVSSYITFQSFDCPRNTIGRARAQLHRLCRSLLSHDPIQPSGRRPSRRRTALSLARDKQLTRCHSSSHPPAGPGPSRIYNSIRHPRRRTIGRHCHQTSGQGPRVLRSVQPR